MALAAGTRLGPYEILEPLGAGGMGEVYRARDTRLDRTVATKVLPDDLAADPQLKARFEREARAVSALVRPNICTLHDIGEEDGRSFLVTEYRTSLKEATMKERRDSFHMPWTAYGVVTILAGVLAFPGCGGSSSSAPSPVPSATPAPVTTVIARGNFAGLQPTDPEEDPEDLYILSFNTTQTGTLDVTVDWTNASNDVDFLLLTGTLEQAMSPACQALDESDCPLEIVTVAVSLDKPEVATLSNAAPGGYIVAVANFGTTNESGIVVVRLTT